MYHPATATLIFLALALRLAHAFPMPQAANAATGGTYTGGSVSNSGSPALVNLWSNNAGGSSGGDASAVDTSRTDSPGDSQFMQTETVKKDSLLDFIPDLVSSDDDRGTGPAAIL